MADIVERYSDRIVGVLSYLRARSTLRLAQGIVLTAQGISVQHLDRLLGGELLAGQTESTQPGERDAYPIARRRGVARVLTGCAR